MKKYGILLCALLMVVMASVGVLSTSAISENADVWDGTATSNWYQSGTELVIDSAEDLAAFVQAVNEGKTFTTVSLECDIVWTAGDAAEWSTTNVPARSWTPIGTESYPFTGTFNGNGHTVSGLYYYDASGNSTEVGFFGYVSSATINNLHVTNSYFHAGKYIGSIVGRSKSGALTIYGCYSDASIFSNGPEKKEHYVGGIVGHIDGESTYDVLISYCSFKGKVVCDYGLQAGGIVGIIRGKTAEVSHCMAVGTITGYNRVAGIVARANSNITISDCYAYVDLFTWGYPNQGSIIGSVRNADVTITIDACYYNGKNYHADTDADTNAQAVGVFKDMPTRLGNYEYYSSTDKTELGNINTSSTYYTDSTNDNSYTTQGNQVALPSSVKKLGGLTNFLAQTSSFAYDIYGEIQLIMPEYQHSHENHLGVWVADTQTNGQKAECMALGCDNVVTRDASFGIIGVSVRTEAPSGIRFLTEVNKNAYFEGLYTGDDSNYVPTNANVKFGTLLIPENMLAGELTVNTPSVVKVQANKIYNDGVLYQTADKFYYSAVLTNIPEKIDLYNCDLVARSYMTYTDSGNTVYVYSDAVHMSLFDTAELTYASGVTDEVKAGVNKILALGAVNENFYANNGNRVLLLENADVDLFNDYADALVANGFEKHINYDYVGNHFAMYYNDDYVVTFYYTPKSIGEYTEDNQDWYAGGANPTDDMEYIETCVRAETIYNVMRVIVEKRSDADLPETYFENAGYERIVDNSIGFIYPNSNKTDVQESGMGYIVRLVDGSFVIIDSGRDFDDPRDTTTDTNADYIYDYLIAQTGGERPVIAAWILTHTHGDHVGAMKAFVSEYYNDVEIEQFIYNFMTDDTPVPAATREQEDFAGEYIRPYYPNAKVIKAHTGYKFFIRNAEVNILFSIDDLIPVKDGKPNFDTMFDNNESIVFDMIIDGKQRLMFTGDMFIPASQALVNMYGDALACDVLQIAHHGNYGATREVNELFWPGDKGIDYVSDPLKFLLLPNAREEQTKNRMDNYENQHFTDLLEDDTYPYTKIYADCDLYFEHGGVDNAGTGSDSGDTDTLSASTEVLGKWKTIPLYTAEPEIDNDNFIYWPDPDDWSK